MQNFFVGILIKVLSDAKVQTIIKNLLSDLITTKIAPLIPLAAASAAKAFAALIPGGAGVVTDVQNVVAVANTVRNDLNSAIPVLNIGVPVIDDIINAWRIVL